MESEPNSLELQMSSLVYLLQRSFFLKYVVMNTATQSCIIYRGDFGAFVAPLLSKLEDLRGKGVRGDR